MSKKIKQGLIIIGLTELEAEIYLKLLKLKKAKVTELAKATKTTRTQLYPLLEKLVKKGVVEKIDKKIVIYKVVKSNEIVSLINKWKKDQLAILKEFENELKKLKKK